VPSRTQFFITLDKSPWLERKHTIFGKVNECGA
jgi:cyclophilin family peptidyl-prolyl cis-trans isomerase